MHLLTVETARCPRSYYSAYAAAATHAVQLPGFCALCNAASSVPRDALWDKVHEADPRWNIELRGYQGPVGAQVRARLPWFLDALPSEQCAKGGAGGYTDALQRDAGDASGVAGLARGAVAASAFRTSYVPLGAQADFIGGMRVRYMLLKFKL